MNIKLQGNNGLSVWNQPMFLNRGLKSTEQKLERQAKCNNQISFFEEQKENLKDMKCETVEEIARKLEMFHTYEEEIAAAKAAYNNEQMFHIMDEAEEIAEKIAENAEKMEPKTPEERKEEALEEVREEVSGTEEGEGILEEFLENAEELSELTESETEELSELREPETEELSELREPETEELLEETEEKTVSGDLKATAGTMQEKENEWKKYYKPMDIRI